MESAVVALLGAKKTPATHDSRAYTTAPDGARRRHGDFESFVDRSGGPDACHPWRGAVDRNGYGRFGKQYRGAHRIACEAANGPPFPGAEAAHSCDNPPCCNGAHLSWKTHAENVAEQFQRGNHRNCQFRAVTP